MAWFYAAAWPTFAPPLTRIVITGGALGIGAETARVLASAGADVTIAVRKPEAGREVAKAIAGKTGNPNVHVASLDLLDRASIAAFAKAWLGPLDILINNAGIMALPDLQRTQDGWELQFATNHLGHFALTLALHDALAAAGCARVINLSSAAHHHSPVVLDDINFERRDYNPWAAYAQSKTANILMAVEGAKRWAGDGISVNAVHPGAIFETGLIRHVEITPDFQKIIHATPWKNVEQGAATSVFVASSPLVEGITGKYFADSNEASVGQEIGEEQVAPFAYDPVAAAQLWELSLRALNG